MTDRQPPLESILEARPPEPGQLLPLLQDIQSLYRHLPEEALRAVARRLDLPLSRVFAVAGFYAALSLKPKGRTVVKVCRGTACHLRGAPAIISSLEKEFALMLGETSGDGAYTLEAVNCLGACALAPVVMVDELTVGGLSPEEVGRLVRERGEAGRAEAGASVCRCSAGEGGKGGGHAL